MEAKKHEKHEFLRRLSNHVSVVTVAGNHLGIWKMCAIAHEMDRKNNIGSHNPRKWRQKT